MGEKTRVNRDEPEAVTTECRKAGGRVITALADVAEVIALRRLELGPEAAPGDRHVQQHRRIGADLQAESGP